MSADAPPPPNRVELVLGVGAFVGWGAFAWFVVLLIELASYGPLVLAQLATYGAVASTALVFAALIGGAFGALLLVEGLAKRFLRGGLFAATGLALVASTPIARRQAAFLTSGDGISGSSVAGLVYVALTLFLMLGLAGVWLWMRCMFSLPPRWEARRNRVTRVAWALLGVGVVAAAVPIITRQLHFYGYFASFATVVSAAFAAGVLGSAVTRPLGRRIGAGLLVAVFGVSMLANDSARAQLRTHGRLFDYSESAIRNVEPDAAFTIDISSPARFACAARNSESLPAPTTMKPVRNVILVSIDALRADYVAKKRKRKLLMPQLVEFSESAVRFNDAHSSYPATVYAMGGAFTGLSPSQISYAPGLPDTIFRAADKSDVDRRLAVLPKDEWFSMPIIGALLVQDALRVNGPPDAKRQTADMLEQLAKARDADESVLAWVHYLEPHAPYQVHPETPSGKGPRGAYRSELRYLDAALGDLFEGLEEQGWFEDSLVIVFSDHGEALGEGDYWGHHVYLDAWITAVPLMMRGPGLEPRVVEDPVALVDVAPTVMHALGVEVPTDVDARSLFQTLESPDPARTIFAEAFPVRGRKLFERAEKPIVTLADLKVRLEHQQNKKKKSYEPKVALIDRDVRLIVHRRGGHARLHWRADEYKKRAEDHSTTEPAVLADKLETMREWHRVQSERIYCRVSNARR